MQSESDVGTILTVLFPASNELVGGKSRRQLHPTLGYLSRISRFRSGVYSVC